MRWLEGGKYNGAEEGKCKLGSLQMDGLLIPSLQLLRVQTPVWSQQDQDAVFTSLPDRGQPVLVHSVCVGEPGKQAQPPVSVAVIVCSSQLTALDLFSVLENLAPSPVTFL